MSRETDWKAVFGAESDPSKIRAVQDALNKLGFANPPLTVDGLVGPKTTAAVLAFQQAKGLSADGIVGPQTEGALGITGGLASPAPKAGVSVKGGGKTGSLVPGVHDSVVTALPAIFGKWEGAGLPFMYTDSKGFVTTGTGNLIDPVGLALALPWKNPDGSLADSGTVQAAWNTVKQAYPGVQSTACASLTSIRLDRAGLNQLLTNTVRQFASYLNSHYPNFASWPADAQMAVLSVSWAWGPGFARVWGGNGAAFDAAVNANPPDFNRAAAIMKTASAHEESINPGIVPRNNANVSMFANAAKVISAAGADVTDLFYPNVADVASAVSSAIGSNTGKLLGVLGIIGLVALFGGKLLK